MSERVYTSMGRAFGCFVSRDLRLTGDCIEARGYVIIRNAVVDRVSSGDLK